MARQGNCFTYNSEYNFEDEDLYREEDDGYYETGKRRLSSLTGPSFGLNLVITLDQTNYMEGEITTQVCQLLKSVVFIELFDTFNEISINPYHYHFTRLVQS